MAVISVPSSATGATYSVRIAGDTPTAAEQARIDAYVAQMDASAAPVTPTVPQEEQTGGVSSAFGLGVDMLQQGYGSAIEGFGESTGIAAIRDYGSGVAEANKQQIEEAYPGLTQYDDVDSVSSALKFYGEQLAQQVPQLGVSLAGGYGGAKLGGALGSVLPGVGTAVGATVGGIGGSILANIPYFYGDNRERQKEVIEETGSNAEVSEGAAFLTSLPQAMLDGLVDRLLIGKIISPSWISRGGIFTRAVKGTGAGAAVEVPTEIGQQVLNRLQAGLPIDDDEAMEEYKQVAITAGIVGGTVRGATNVVGGDIAKVEKAKADEQALKDLEEDQKEEAEDATKRIAFGEAAIAPPPVEQEPAEKQKAPETTSELISTLVSSRARPTDTGAATPSTPLPPVPGAIQLQDLRGAQPPGAVGAPPAAAPTGLSIKGIDDAISNGVASLTVEEDGKQVPFNKFAISVDGDKAEVGFVERAKSARKGVGYDAYVKLGTELAGRGVTLQASSTKQAPGQELWKKLADNGYAKLNPATKKLEFVAPAQPAAAGTAPTQESLVTPDAPRPAQPFRWRDYTAATQEVVNAKDASVPAIQKAASTDPKKPVPPVVAKAIRDRMVADGVIVADKKSKGGFRVVPTRVPQVDQTESYRRTLDDLQQDAQDATAAQQKALLDARRAEQTGSKADARKFNLQADAAAEKLSRIQATRQEVEARLPRVTAEVAVPRTEAPLSPVAGGRAAVPITEAPARAQATAVSDRAKRLTQSLRYYQGEAARKAAEVRRLREAGKKVQLPKSDQQRIVDLEQQAASDARTVQQIRAQLARPAADIEQDRTQKAAAAAKEASVAAEAAARTPTYTAKEGQLFTALRRRLDNLGLSDVKLVAERVIRPAGAPQNALVEGMMDVDSRNGNRIIALALGVYDPKMTQQELFDSISAVMNHEVIHAIRSLGLFTDGEWKTLSDLAARQRYMKAKNGKTVERSYTYLQRAQQMYADATPEIQSEEAVAEMFRDYVAGRLKIGGKPKTLMDRIKGFFKALWGAHAEAGLTDPNAIFEGVRFGDIGKRERKAAAPVEDETRLSVKISDKDRKLTVLDRYEQGRFRDDRPRNAKGIPVSTRSKESAMVRLQADRGNKVFESNETNKKVIARLMAAEAEAALNSDRSAIGWYDAKLRAAKSVLALLHPEIATDPGSNAAMDYATAVTSNGMAVVDNYRAANEQYEYWQKNGRFLVRGYGNQGKSMEKAFSFYNKLKDRGMTDAQISDYLSQDTTVAELRKNDILRELDIEIDSKEFAAAKVKVSYVIGPKIGQGFYQNLRGNFEPLTMDRWWMRMFNRLTGNPFVVVTDETLKNNADRVVQSANEPLNDYEREVIEQAKLNKDIDMVTEGNALEFAKEVDRIFQKAYKDADEGQRPEKTELFLAAGRYKLNSSPQLEESPRGPGDRQFMRETTNVARKYLKDATGVDITPADLQALLWYAEKRLWDSLGIRKGQGEDNDYVDGAIALLRNKGYGDDSILEALPAGERFRIDPVRYPAGQDGSVRGPDAEGDTAQAETRLSAIPAAAGEAEAGRGDRSRGQAVRGIAPLEGAPNVRGATGPDPRLISVAEKYATENGIDLRRQGKYVEVDEPLAARIAEAFDAMEHDPSNPQVKAAYAELIKQTRAQYDALADAGYKFWFIDGDNPGEYASSPWNAMRDLRANQSMGVFPTISGFGTREVDVSNNPLLEETGLMWPYGSPDGTPVPVLANDLFRAVHDAFGHGIEGAGFRANGEENAWQAHIRLFTGLAKGALTSETRGQNSWLNFGPFGEQNRNAKVEDTIFADQKVGLMPEWTWTEGLAPDAEPYSPDARMSIRYAVSPITANVRQNIQANQKALMYARSSDLIARILTGTKLVKKDTAREFADGLLRRFQDSMLPIGRMIQELSAKGMTITDAMDPYLQEELMHGVVGQKIGANQDGLYAPVVQAIKKLNVPKARIDQLIAASNAASADGKGYVALAMGQSDSPRMVLADAYLYAKHARERNRYIKANKDKTNNSGSGMTDAEAEAILRWFDGLDAPNKQAIADMAKGIRLVVANTNQTRVDGGLIAEDAVDKDGNTVVLGSQYKFYVPLRGVTDGDVDTNEDDFTGPPGTPRYGARGREDRRALGRYDYAADLVANVFTQNQNAILRAERNKVGQSLLKLLRADTSKTTAYAEVLKRAPTMRASVDGTMRDVPDPRAYNDPDILVVKEDGKEVFVRFRDERVAGAMNGKNGFSPTTGASLTSAMQTVNRYLANINTSYNPEFFITNMFRDLSTAGVNINQFEMEGLTADAIKNVKSALVGIKRVIRNEDDTSEWSKVYKDFVASGGQNATNQFNTLSDEMSNIQGILGDISESGIRGKWASVKNSFIGQKTGSLLSLVENYNTIVENGIRVATYKALIDRGMSKQRAAQAARNVTVNFAKGGDYRQLMGAWYLFYNASLQGSFALLNAAVRSPKVRKVWAGIMVAGLLQDQLNALLSDEDEDGQKIYDKIPKHVLEHNFILPDVFGITDRSYISIPMPYGLNMAHNLGRAVSRAARGEYDAGEATSTIFGTIADTLNPIGGAESWANFVAPTVADPFIDILENEDFADKPIYKEGLPFDRTPAPASQLYWSTTSPSAVWLTNNLNSLTGGNEVRPGFVDWSPDIVDFWFEFATGGVGRFVQRIAELPFKDTSEGLSDEIVRDIPFFRKLVGSVSEREDMGAYIEGAKAVLTAGDELKRAREVGDAAWAKETIQRYGKELRLVGPIKSLEGALRETSKMRNQINANTNIPDEQKKVLLDRLEERRQMILSRANSLLRNAGL
jgi:hypothetical protein